jgi:hypothetical protein
MEKRAALARIFLAVTLLGTLPAAVSVGAGNRRPKSYGIPKLGPDQLWISSVPVGLEVRSGETADGKPILGRTPLVLNARSLGRSVTVIVRKKEYGGRLPDQISLIDFSAKNSHSLGIQRGKEVEDLARALTYELDRTRKQTLIALFQSRDSSLSEVARFYPPGSNFRFSHGPVEKRLAEKGVPPDYIRRGLRLLERGGKVALPGKNGWLIAEVTATGQVDLLEPPANPPG